LGTGPNDADGNAAACAKALDDAKSLYGID
jgi:hypothetical protein